MRRYGMIAALLAGVLLVGSGAWAQQDEGREGRRGGRRRGGRRQQVSLLDRLTTQLDLTDDQQDQVKDFIGEYEDAVKELPGAGDRESIRDRIRKAREDGDQEALADIFKEMREAGQARAKLREELYDNVAGILSEEQQPKFMKMTIGGGRYGGASQAARIRAALRFIKLTPEQKAQINKIIAETEKQVQKLLAQGREGHEGRGRGRGRGRGGQGEEFRANAVGDEEGDDRGGRRGGRGGRRGGRGGQAGRRPGGRPDPKTAKAVDDLWKEAIAKIKKVLGPVKAAKFEKLLAASKPAPTGLAALDLTDDQKKEIAEIRKEYMEKIRDAEGEERNALRKEMQEAIRDVLTDEQKAQLEKNRRPRGGRGGRNRDRGGEE